MRPPLSLRLAVRSAVCVLFSFATLSAWLHYVSIQHGFVFKHLGSGAVVVDIQAPPCELTQFRTRFVSVSVTVPFPHCSSQLIVVRCRCHCRCHCCCQQQQTAGKSFTDDGATNGKFCRRCVYTLSLPLSSRIQIGSR